MLKLHVEFRSNLLQFQSDGTKQDPMRCARVVVVVTALSRVSDARTIVMTSVSLMQSSINHGIATKSKSRLGTQNSIYM